MFRRKQTYRLIFSSLSFWCLFILITSSMGNPIGDNECTKGKDIGIKKEIVNELFKLKPNQRDVSILYDYNSYKCNFLGDPYGSGSHSGWDARVRRKSDGSPEYEFYCLTPGIVIADGRIVNEKGERVEGNCETSARAIAIYDEVTGTATHYLHASAIHPSVQIGEYIHYGSPLGTQGNCGRGVTGPHVHIEVRIPKDICPAPFIKYKNLPKSLQKNLAETSTSTADPKHPTKDPIPYLYDIVQLQKEVKATVIPDVWAKLRMQYLQGGACR